MIHGRAAFAIFLYIIPAFSLLLSALSYMLPSTRPAIAAGALVTTAGRTIDQYYRSQHCAVCSELVLDVNQPGSAAGVCICRGCRAAGQRTAYVLLQQHRLLDKQCAHLSELCASCSGVSSSTVPCVSLDCSGIALAHCYFCSFTPRTSVLICSPHYAVLFERLKLRDLASTSSRVLESCGM